MEARTKFQKRVTELAKQLNPLTDKQEQWMLKQMPADSDSWRQEHVCFIDKVEDCQVFRVFQVYTSAPDNKSGYASKGSIHKCITNIGECYQIWVSSKGERCVRGYDLFGYHCNSRAIHMWHRRTRIWHPVLDEFGNHKKVDGKWGGYYEYWIEEVADGMEIKSVNLSSVRKNSKYYYGYRCTFDYPTTSLPLYPEYELLPEFVRNTKETDFRHGHNMEGDAWMTLMLQKNTESLYKIDEDLFRFYIENVPYKWRNKFYTALKIANRHHYFDGLRKGEITIWRDHIQMCIENGHDLHNPHYVAPKNLIEDHRRMVEERRRREEAARIERERLNALAEAERAKAFNDAYIKRIGKYLDIKLSNDKYDIFVCPSVSDMAQEGYAMHHCVYACKYYEKKDSLILFCRDKQGERVVTIELKTNKWNIPQCYAKYDKIHPDDAQIRALVMDNIDLFKSAKKIKKAKIITHPAAEQPQEVALAA